ncbi:hypothetical protein FRC15_005267 [Serendipita sp. 397]|nr:hypothetical protein FRC15_005267 [Serendipita sp. 397]
MSGGQPPNNKKRNASTAGMGPPDQRSTTKRSRLDTALETKLTECKSVLQPDELRVSWEDYDPGSFMKSMQQLSRVINALDLKTVGKYISNGGLAADLFTLDVQGTKLKTGLEDPLMDTDVKRAREIMITYVTRVRACLNALVEQANAKPAPSYFADHNEWRVWQEKSDAILCLRPAKQKGLPIPLMHPAFCTFTRHFYEPLLDEHITKYLSTSKQLCQVMPSAFDSEKARREAFEEIFGSLDMKVQSHVEFYISPKVSQVSTVMESGGTTDVVKTINYGGGHLVLILEEFKVESTGDAYMQICRSYEGLCGDAKNESLLKFGNPTFLLCILGPYLMVCGAVKRENVHVEPLTPFLPMFPGFGTEGRLMQLTHCLRALKEGTDKLREFWYLASCCDVASGLT